MNDSHVSTNHLLSIKTSDISETAAEAIRFKFNPSGDATVNKIKTLTGALITELEKIRSADPTGGREAAVAITNVQTASMWAVLAATKGK